MREAHTYRLMSLLLRRTLSLALGGMLLGKHRCTEKLLKKL
jgi:hypothetical protein